LIRDIPLPRLIALATMFIGICWMLWRMLAPAGIQVNRTLRALEHAMETENYWKCISLLSKDFYVPGHGYEYPEAKQGLYYLFREYDGIQLQLIVTDTEFHARGVTVQSRFQTSFWPSGSPHRMEKIEGHVDIVLNKGILGYKILSASVDESVIRRF